MEDQNVIIIGSGPSGAMAAWQLIQNNTPVTMLESGTTVPKGFLLRLNSKNIYRWKSGDGFENNAHYEATGDPNTQWFVNYSPGGLSNDWTGAVPRFSPEDFHEGERLHEKYRWPLTYEELAPYYDKAERLLDVTAAKRAPDGVSNLPAGYADFHHQIPKDWQDIAQIARQNGQGLTTIPIADGSPWMLTKRSTAFNSYSKIIKPLLKSPLFTFITGAHVLKLNWSSTTKKVDSLLYTRRDDNSQHTINTSAVIVTCGPLNSTKLLFNSACPDFPQGLGNNQGVLGKYLHDHPREWWSVNLDRPLTLLSPSAYLTRKPYAESQPLLANSWTIGLVSTKDKLLSLFHGKGNTLGVQVFGTMVPDVHHFVALNTSQKDEWGQPGLDICIKYDNQTIDNMVTARELFLSLLNEAGYPCTLNEVVPQLVPGNSVHYGGTVRMHASPQYGMLDSWNRLHEVQNVIVSDASSFTTGAEKNPTLTAMALSARAADKLTETLKGR